MVLVDGGPLGVQLFFSVFPEVSDGTILRFLLQPGVRGALQAYWKAASPGPMCRCLLRSLRYFYLVLLV